MIKLLSIMLNVFINTLILMVIIGILVFAAIITFNYIYRTMLNNAYNDLVSLYSFNKRK
jgi:Tfp pilus assembly protein PilE